MAYGTTAQVAVELGRDVSSVTPAETAQWEAWIGRVESAIERRFARLGLTLAAQVAAGDPPAALVASIVTAAVIRKVHNPDGLTSTTVSIDDGSLTKRRDGYRGGDPLALEDAEWAALLPVPDFGAFSTRPGFDATHPMRWLG